MVFQLLKIGESLKEAAISNVLYSIAGRVSHSKAINQR